MSITIGPGITVGSGISVGSGLASGFTITSSDFTQYYAASGITANGTLGFTNSGSSGPGENFYGPWLGTAQGGNPVLAQQIYNYWLANGLSLGQSDASYVFDAVWDGSSSPTSNKVIISLYYYDVNTIYFNFGTVYTGDSVWQTPGQNIYNNGSLKSATGTYNFPATFSLYGPTIIQDNANWC